MRVTLRGVRGSVAVPDRAMARYGGNTSCVSVALSDGSRLVLDAGTGIRELGRRLVGIDRPIHVLLTHLHLDHINGLLFFAPLFDPGAQVTVWGPAGSSAGLRERLARYLSAPLSPIEIRDLPATVEFRSCPSGPFRIGPALVTAELVCHRGPTLGYRIEEQGQTVCYLPDHEPGLGQDLESAPADWISGHALAANASLLIHDAQYDQDEYCLTAGWGHSTVRDALAFARRAEAERVLLFHHDPGHDDTRLDALQAQARELWSDRGGDPLQVALAVEGERLELT